MDKSEDLTIGQWRQAVTSFGILYPRDKFDWEAIDLASEMPVDPPVTYSEPFYLPCIGVAEPSALVALNQIRIMHHGRERWGIISTKVSDRFIADKRRTFDIGEFEERAYNAGHVALDLATFADEPFNELAGSTPLSEVMDLAGIPTEQKQSKLAQVTRASMVITNLMGHTVDVAKLFPRVRE